MSNTKLQMNKNPTVVVHWKKYTSQLLEIQLKEIRGKIKIRIFTEY